MGRRKLDESMIKKTSADFASLNMRIPKTLADNLKTLASTEKMTVTAYVTSILENISKKEELQQKELEQIDLKNELMKINERFSEEVRSIHSKLDTTINLISKL